MLARHFPRSYSAAVGYGAHRRRRIGQEGGMNRIASLQGVQQIHDVRDVVHRVRRIDGFIVEIVLLCCTFIGKHRFDRDNMNVFGGVSIERLDDLSACGCWPFGRAILFVVRGELFVEVDSLHILSQGGHDLERKGRHVPLRSQG